MTLPILKQETVDAIMEDMTGRGEAKYLAHIVRENTGPNPLLLAFIEKIAKESKDPEAMRRALLLTCKMLDIQDTVDCLHGIRRPKDYTQ